jgi:transcription initiation factor TFIIB
MEILVEPVVSVCLECGSGNIIQDLECGEVVCRGCGLVVSEPAISRAPEWRSFDKDEYEERTRVGLPPSFSIHDKGLSTMIGPIYKDAYGRKIPQEAKLRMYRLKRWHIRSMIQGSPERNLAQAMGELDVLTDKLHAPREVKEQAALIYRKALRRGLVRGRSILAVVTASLYAAFRATRTIRTLEEVAAHSPLGRKEISRCYRILLEELELRMPVPRAVHVVPKVGSKLFLGEETQRKAIGILEEAERLRVTAGKDPMGLAAAALYLACVVNEERRTQKMIAEAAGVTEVTIRNRHQELKKVLNLDFVKTARG